MAPDIDHYIVFVKYFLGYSPTQYCVAGKEISHTNAICFNSYKEAHDYANKLSIQKETYDESRSTGKRQDSP